MIQRLQTNDLDHLKALRAMFGVVFEESHWHEQAPNDAYLQNILADQNIIILASLNDEAEVVGGLVAYALQKIDRTGCEMYLYDLAITETYRKQGRATALIEALKTIGKEIGAYVIFVQADNVDTPAIALYTKLSKSVERDISHFDIAIE